MANQFSLRIALRAARSFVANQNPKGFIRNSRAGSSRAAKGDDEVVPLSAVLADYGVACDVGACIEFIDANEGELGARAREVFARPQVKAVQAPKGAPKVAPASTLQATIVEVERRLAALLAEEAAQLLAAKAAKAAKTPAKKAAQKPPTAKQVERALALLARVG